MLFRSTGSTRTAKVVAATCAAHMTPVVLECGGKDPVIVAHDADIERAADATVWSAFSNAGQTCIGAERVYVDERVADKFIAKVLEIAKGINPGAPGMGKYGPTTMPKQIPIIQSHIDDAIARGATVLLGGSNSVKAPFVEPVIFCNVPEDSIAIKFEHDGMTVLPHQSNCYQETLLLTPHSSLLTPHSLLLTRNRMSRQIFLQRF